MRIVITGATGNVGSSLVRALGDEDAVTSIVGLARRAPKWRPSKTEWSAVDISTDDLAGHFAEADAVVHLAWQIQPSRRTDLLWRTNVAGSRRVFEAAARAGVSAIVYGSSVGAYSPGPKDRRVDEGWPVMGVPTSFYSRHKAEVERSLDAFEARQPGIRVVRLRPGLLFKRASATEQRRLFAGPFVPVTLLRQNLVPFVPDVDGLRFQALHTSDVADAYRRAITQDVRGAFNLAAEPVLDPQELGRILHARTVKVSPRLLRAIVRATWRMHLQPTPPGWLDMGLNVPIMDASRAHDELGWRPRFSSSEALLELLEGMRTEAGTPTPPLDPATSGRGRISRDTDRDGQEIWSLISVRPETEKEDTMTDEQDPKKAPPDGPGGAESSGGKSGSGYDRPGGGSPEGGGKQSDQGDSDPGGSSPEESSESADKQANVEK